MQPPVIVWLRRDLRLADNPALFDAAAQGRPVVALYVHQKNDAGAAARWWLHHSLDALGKELPLTLRTGDAGDALRAVLAETGANTVYWNRLYEPAAIARDSAIETALVKEGIHVKTFKGNVLFEPKDIHTGSGTPFKVFTPFYKACLAAEGLIGPALPKPPRLRAVRATGVPLAALGLLPRLAWADKFAPGLTPGEEGAWSQARTFIEDDMTAYESARDYPATPGTSRLSPHLHAGTIAARALWHAASPHPGAAAFLRALCWREFSAHLLFHTPALPHAPLQPAFAAFPWRPDPSHFDAWKKGLTGYPIVDAGMRELMETGWMHNRVRMIAGSFLVKHLLQPWQAGAAWFMDSLIDADTANNAASWQWVAGCGTDAAPYFRVFNPVLQGRKFDAAGIYVKRYVSALRDVPDKYIHTPWESGMRLDYPAPIVDHAAGRARALAAYAELKKNGRA